MATGNRARGRDPPHARVDSAQCGGAVTHSSDLPDLSYGRQWIDESDIAAVVACLRGDWLTQGSRVGDFERALCAATGARHAVAVSSGTAALHLAALAAGVGPGTTA